MFSLPRLRAAALLLSAGFIPAHATELELNKPLMAHLAALPHGEKLKIDGFPIGPARNGTVNFQRIEVYAPDAHVYVVDAKGRHEIPRSDQVYLRGYSDDGRARVALSLKADGAFADGNGSGPDGSFALRAKSTPKARTTFPHLRSKTRCRRDSNTTSAAATKASRCCCTIRKT